VQVSTPLSSKESCHRRILRPLQYRLALRSCGFRLPARGGITAPILIYSQFCTSILSTILGNESERSKTKYLDSWSLLC
jgi:hypothetical protein